MISPDGRISIAVMPFQNMTNDTLWNIWQNGIQINLITSLSNSEELKVRQIETVNGLLESQGIQVICRSTPSVASSISQKLDASSFRNREYKPGRNTIRLNAWLTDTKTEELAEDFSDRRPS